MLSALVLNASFEPLSVVSSHRATCLVLAEKADVLEDTGDVLHSERLCLPCPSVIRLRYMVKVPYVRRAAMSRRAIFARDDYRCQYCGDRADSIDHVVPRSKGGPHSWENVAAACRPCNLGKARSDSGRGRHASGPPVSGATRDGVGRRVGERSSRDLASLPPRRFLTSWVTRTGW